MKGGDCPAIRESADLREKLRPLVPRRLLDGIAHRSETDMRRAKIDFLRLSSGRPVAGTEIQGTQVGPAFDHSAGELSRREANVNQARSLWFRRGHSWMARPIPIAGPLPDVADHVI